MELIGFNLETCVNEIMVPHKIKAKEFFATYFPIKSTKTEFVILTRENMKVSRVEPQNILEPNQFYFVVSRPFWQMAVRILTRSRQERYKKSSLNMEEILLNPSLQKIAKAKKDKGERHIFDLYSDFLKIASHTPAVPFSLDEKKDKNQYQMCKIAIQILCYFLQNSNENERRKVGKDAQSIRSQPLGVSSTGGICVVGAWVIIFLEGVLIGLSMIIPAFL